MFPSFKPGQEINYGQFSGQGYDITPAQTPQNKGEYFNSFQSITAAEYYRRNGVMPPIPAGVDPNNFWVNAVSGEPLSDNPEEAQEKLEDSEDYDALATPPSPKPEAPASSPKNPAEGVKKQFGLPFAPAKPKKFSMPSPNQRLPWIM